MRTEMLGNADDRFFHADDAAVFAERPVVLLVHPARRNAPSVAAVADWIGRIHAPGSL
jgi:hypothetical protein